jgi:hypothetical protein
MNAVEKVKFWEGDHLDPMKTEFLLFLKPVVVRNFPKALRRKEGQRQQQLLRMRHHREQRGKTNPQPVRKRKYGLLSHLLFFKPVVVRNFPKALRRRK